MGRFDTTPEATADVGQPTPTLSEGPYFKPGSPEESSLVENGSGAQRLLIAGRVLTTGGQAISGAKLDFWQADENGVYDNGGCRYRGHQFSQQDGTYRLETVLPRVYTGRTRHIHVKVSANGMRELTTQLYFPGEPGNAGDRIFNERLLLTNLQQSGNTLEGSFDFVLAPG